MTDTPTAVEVDDHDWLDDEKLQSLAPFDETRCTDCDTVIGAHLRECPETSADIPTSIAFWLVTDERLLCEDCWIDLIDPLPSEET